MNHIIYINLPQAALQHVTASVLRPLQQIKKKRP